MTIILSLLKILQLSYFMLYLENAAKEVHSMKQKTFEDGSNFNYNVILVDSDMREDCSSIFQGQKDIIIEELPPLERDMMIDYFSKKTEDASKENKRILLITSQQSTLYFAREFSMDTCLINNRTNDFVSFSTTYEVPNVKQLKSLH